VNSLIGTKELLAQLATLKNVIQDFSAREQKLNTTFRDQSAKENNAFATKEQQQVAAASERMAAAKEDFAVAQERLQARIARRKTRISRAYNAVRDIQPGGAAGFGGCGTAARCGTGVGRD